LNKTSHQYKEVKMNLCMARCRRGIVPVKKLYAPKSARAYGQWVYCRDWDHWEEDE